MSSLEDFSTGEDLRDTFSPSIDKSDFTLLDRVSTKDGSPIIVSFDLPFKTVNQATLKISLLAGEAFIGNEFKLTSFNLNGRRFEVSDTRNSVNVVDKANDTNLNKVLKPFDNQLSVNFTAPIGAGFVLPDAEISAILTVIGERDPFSLANLPNTTQISKKVERIGERLIGIGIVGLIAVIVIGILLIVFGGKLNLV